MSVYMAAVVWTEGRLRTFITSVIRKGFSRYPPKYETLAEAKLGKQVNSKTGRLAEHYKCSSCNGSFTNSEVQVDHINPVVPITGWVSWDSFIENLFCSKDNLQVLCSKCHKKKSREENEERRKQKTSV